MFVARDVSANVDKLVKYNKYLTIQVNCFSSIAYMSFITLTTAAISWLGIIIKQLPFI